MPTKKPAKKRAPRTDWKARALHCEEVIGVQNQIAQGREKALSHEIARAESAQSAATSWENRATSAEKHNAILLAEREARETAKVRKRPYCLLCYRIDCDGSCAVNIAANALVSDCRKESLYWAGAMEASWQRFKSWAARWSIEIACAIAVLAVFALASWYALRWGK